MSTLQDDIELAREAVNRQPGCPLPNCHACQRRQERIDAFERVAAAVPPTRAELTGEERAVLDDCASLPVGTLEFLRKEGSIPLSNLAVSELARRAALVKVSDDVIAQLDTALARVKDLEAELREALDLLQSKEGERLMRMAAETALASARILIEQAADGEHEWSPKFRGECSHWLTSHPSPAPCAGCADAKVLLSEARERLPQDRRPHSFFRRAGAWLKEHP